MSDLKKLLLAAVPDLKLLENIPYKETNNYVRKILRDYKIYQELYN